MRKKRAIRNFAGIIILCLIVLIFTIISFPIPDSDYTFVGFAGGIDRGVNYNGGTIITYNVYSTSSLNTDASKGLSDRAVRLEQLLANQNYSANVYKTSNSSIKIEVGFNGVDDECKNVNDIVNLSNLLKITLDGKDEHLLTGYDIEDAQGMKNENTYGVAITFTKEGQKKFEALTEATGNVSVVIGGFEEKLLQFSVNEKYSQRAIFISGNMKTQKEADILASQINSSRNQYTFEEVSRVVVSKEQANANLIKTAVIAIVMFALISAFLFARYKKLGLCGVLAMLIAVLCQILLMMLLPSIVLSPISFVASLLTMVMGGIICACLFEAMKKEYALGKKIHASIKFGFKKNYAFILDGLAVLSASFLTLLFVGTKMIKEFAACALIGIVVYGLSCLLLSYVFSKLYVDINPSKREKYGFKREEHVNEIK